ncbi:MAG: Acyl-CoA:1-acyl-sn-glycerol-3-phosphate acyltransferase [uncultured Thermomicrobiales bacterium]|uniref:1-acyl-sn-glycerol-3-phosphate acyltransferase n=1 Tax=uncultured Thermomicrobiales bacterium TaxID=1645740 RepID=A0A6J4UYY2_9BACT|nr:MAG: Acyl-CoA:1-acyl-sn-glycerol-3-phosphate acyltransferase [uncultured Thermomicrobiales bacterium]
MTTPSRLDLERGTIRGRPFRILRPLLLALLTRLVGLRVEGLEHVPASGPILVVANHLHNADPVLLAVAFPRPLHFMAKKELFAIPGVSWIIRRVGAFPVDRGKPDRSAIRRVEATLAAGIAVEMFPEGTRSSTGALGRAFPGAAFLALRSKVPILPVAIVGSERLPFNGTKGTPSSSKWRSAESGDGIVIRIQAPFSLPAVVDGRRVPMEEASDHIMRQIAAGLPPAYRGPYGKAGDPVAAKITRDAMASGSEP